MGKQGTEAWPWKIKPQVSTSCFKSKFKSQLVGCSQMICLSMEVHLISRFLMVILANQLKRELFDPKKELVASTEPKQPFMKILFCSKEKIKSPAVWPTYIYGQGITISKAILPTPALPSKHYLCNMFTSQTFLHLRLDGMVGWWPVRDK